MKKLEYPTQEEIKKVLNYDSEIGVFTWKKRAEDIFRPSKWRYRNCKIWNTRFAGTVAGHFEGRYITIRLGKRQYWAHRLAYIYIYGKLTNDEIDHINREKTDNRISELRCVDRLSNQLNVGKTIKNTSGIVGVYYDNARLQWHAQIKAGSKPRFLGRYPILRDAVQARYDAEVKYGFTKINPDSTAYQYLKEENNYDNRTQ